MELTREKFSLKLDGVVHELNYPTVKQLKEIDSKKETLSVEKICKIVEDCGLKKEIIDGLQADHLNKIVEGLMGKKKA